MNDLRAWDNAHVWHPFTPMSAHMREETPIIERGEGFSLFDIDGREYLDGISSLWCNVHGHRVPEIDAALRAQLDRVGHSTLLGLSSEPSITLAKRLVDRVPEGLTRVFYSDSGSTAVEVALKLAFQAHNQRGSATVRDRFLTVGNAYHGDTIGSVSLGGIELFHRVYGPLLFQKLTVPPPVALRVPETHSRESWLAHCFESLEAAFQQHGEHMLAAVIEPLVQGAAGILVHPAGYLRRMRELCTEFDVPLIADEVAVGFGRTGTLFACEQENVAPDFLCLAKGLTGGYLPLAATLTTEDVFQAFLGEPHEGRTFFHGHTFTGNAMGCAAAIASMNLFDQNNVLANVRKNESIIRERLDALGDHPNVAEVRQKGTMVGIELVSDRASLTPFPEDRRTGHRVTLAARKRGLIIRPIGDVVVLMPAPAMPPELVARVCELAIESIDEAVS